MIIVLLKQSGYDADRIFSLLEKYRQNRTHQLNIDLIYLQSLKEGKAFFETQFPDLLISGLEFTDENTTSLVLLKKYEKYMPVIVVSRLTHYEKTILQQLHIRAFIPTDLAEKVLFQLIDRLLSQDDTETEDILSVRFRAKNKASKNFSLYSIHHITKIAKDDYMFYFINGTSERLTQVNREHLKEAIVHQKHPVLLQISRDTVININCVHNICKNSHGRRCLSLVNLPDIIFPVSPNYEASFRIYFPDS